MKATLDLEVFLNQRSQLKSSKNKKKKQKKDDNPPKKQKSHYLSSSSSSSDEEHYLPEKPVEKNTKRDNLEGIYRDFATTDIGLLQFVFSQASCEGNHASVWELLHAWKALPKDVKARWREQERKSFLLSQRLREE